MTYLRRTTMSKIFLLGNLYNELTEEQIETKLKYATEYERLKNTYVNEVYKNNDSKMVIWNLYENNISYYEKNLGKDVYQFTVLELDSLISSIASNSINIKANIFSFCNQYIEWCISKRLISINNMNALDRDVYSSISQKLASSKLIGYNEFWDMITYMETKTDIQNIMPIILSYYCISGADMEWLRGLKLSDLDEENEVVVINGGEVVIPIDKKFIKYCYKANEDANFDDKYFKTDLIVKPTKNSVNDLVAENTVYNRIYDAFADAKIKRIKLNDLAKSRKIFLLLQIRKDRFLSNKDFQRVCEMFNPTVSISIYDSLKKYYVMATKDKVLGARAKDSDLIDVNADKNMENIMKNLGWS